MKEWKEVIASIVENKTIQRNMQILTAERKTKVVYPAKDNTFRAFRLCPISQVKIVIIGQDPYYQKGVADGLAFSTKQEKTPSSLQIIFKELTKEYPESQFETNSLEWWAKQGVLLLNTSLSVRQNDPTSHTTLWKLFTLTIVRFLNSLDQRIVWMLWGAHAQSYKRIISNADHLKLEAPHPAAEVRGSSKFTGCGHFKQANEFLELVKRGKIDWNTYKEDPYPIEWNYI